MLSIFVTLLLIPHIFALDPYSKFSRIDLPPGGPIGPESVALDRLNRGPYVTVSDGRVLKYQGTNAGFVDFAFTAPNRNKQLCDGVSDMNLGPQCGRVLAFSFDSLTGRLYLADIFFGLFEVGPNGGRGTAVANSAGGVRFNYLNSCDVNPITREVILTDANQNTTIRDFEKGNFHPDSSGRIIKYNPFTKEVKVLLDGLPFLGGAAFSHDGSSVVFSVFPSRIMKYSLITHTTSVVLDIPAGNPLKIKRAPKFGEFWVAADVIQQPGSYIPLGYKFNFLGELLLTKNLQGQYNTTRVNVLQEYDINGGTLYVGSRSASYVGVLNKR